MTARARRGADRRCTSPRRSLARPTLSGDSARRRNRAAVSANQAAAAPNRAAAAVAPNQARRRWGQRIEPDDGATGGRRRDAAWGDEAAGARGDLHRWGRKSAARCLVLFVWQCRWLLRCSWNNMMMKTK